MQIRRNLVRAELLRAHRGFKLECMKVRFALKKANMHGPECGRAANRSNDVWLIPIEGRLYCKLSEEDE